MHRQKWLMGKLKKYEGYLRARREMRELERGELERMSWVLAGEL